jgi:tetratricopeptide (TPR) repeat protein
MTPEQTRNLIDQLDESRTGKQSASLQRLIAEDIEAAQEWSYLNLAVDALKETGLYEQVGSVRETLNAEQAAAEQQTVADDRYTDQYIAPPANRAIPQIPAAKASGGIVRTINRYGLRAAAVMLILTGGSTVYKYVTTSSESLYGRYYSSFGLNTSRGAGTETPIMQAYNDKNWKTVLSLATATKKPDNQTEFLAGMANLELKQCDEAINHFEQVLAANAQAGTDFYQDDAEYYLAISWLACHKVNQAMPMLEKIKADTHHQYHEKVAKMSFFDLRLAQYKENK